MCGCTSKTARKNGAAFQVTWASEVDPATGTAPLVRRYMTRIEMRAAMRLKPGGVSIASGARRAG